MGRSTTERVTRNLIANYGHQRAERFIRCLANPDTTLDQAAAIIGVTRSRAQQLRETLVRVTTTYLIHPEIAAIRDEEDPPVPPRQWDQ